MGRITEFPNRWDKGTDRNAYGGFNVFLDSLKQGLHSGAAGDSYSQVSASHVVKVYSARKEVFLSKCHNGNHL